MNLRYSTSLAISCARGSWPSSSPASPSFGGRSIRDFICASVAAITRNSPATSRFRSFISSMYSTYWSAIVRTGMS